MNIWLLTGEYPPEYGGGIAAYAYHTAQMLAGRGHQVTVFASSESQPPGGRSEETAGDIRVVRFGLNQTPQSAALGEFARWSYDAAAVLADYLKSEGPPDVLESQEYLGLPYFTLQRRWLGEAGFGRLPVLVTAHTPLYVCNRYDSLPEYRFPVWWIGEMERFSLRAADGVVFPSAALLHEIERDLPGISAASRVIPNPYEAENTGAESLPPEERRGFLYIAKLERRKGIEALLNTFQRLWEVGLDEPLILVGGDWYNETEQRWMSEGLRTLYDSYIARGLLQWRNKQPPAEVRQTLGQVRGAILPSLFENYPYAVLEAMAAGCPVIVSSSGGHAEIVEDGISGLVFSHHIKNDLGQKIQALLELNSSQWRSMSEAGHERVTKISGYKVVAPQKEAALEETVERARSNVRRSFPFLREIPGRPPCSGQRPQSQNDLLSIVIPFYNFGEYLEDTLKSIIPINNIPNEVIVVDDGSDDPLSLQKLDELSARYPFRLIRTENQGLAMARNTGALAARGEFLAFLDADDCMDIQFYRQALEILRHYPELSFVGCWAEYFGDADGYWPTWNPEPPYALVHNPINTSSLVYRRADFLRYGLNDPLFKHGLEDYDSLLSLLENGCRGVAIPNPYFKYRVRSASMYHQASSNVKIVSYEWLAKKHAALYREFAEDVVGLISTNGPGYLYDNPTLWHPGIGFLASQPAPAVTATMPPAPARVYFFFALRAFLLRPYRWLIGKIPWLARMAERVKTMLGVNKYRPD